MNNLSDKKIIFILRAVIAFIIFLIGLFLIIAILDFRSKDENINSLSTTTRRTYQTTTIPKKPGKDEMSTTTTTSSSTTLVTKSTNKTGSGATKTTKRTTTAQNSTSGESTNLSPVPVTPDYKIAEGASKHPLALDNWEWDIVSELNRYRTQNGLNELLVAEDLRTIAETAADKFYLEGEEAVKEYLDGYNNYRLWSNLNITKDEIIKNTIKAVSITTNKNLKYIGVGVLYRQNGEGSIPTYYYCVVYE